MSIPNGFDTKSSLERWFNNHALNLTEKEREVFVTSNFATIDLVGRAWRPMLFSNEVIADLLKCADATDDFFKAYSCLKGWDERALEWVSSQPYITDDVQLPPPFHNVSFSELHQIAGYPKRAPLVNADWLEYEAQQKFLNSMHNSNQDEPDSLLGEAGRDYYVFHSYLPAIRRMLDEVLPTVAEMQKSLRNLDPFAFSPGAVADACTNPFCKWFRARYYTWSVDSTLDYNVYPDPVAHRNLVEESFRTLANDWHSISERELAVSARIAKAIRPRYAVKAMCVPKQLNALRVVCPERAYNAQLQNALMLCIRSFWKRRKLDGMFCWANQELSRQAAREGAATGRFATVDSTAASDTIFRDWMREINHPSLNFLMEYMPTHVKWGSKVYPMEMFGTMGSPLTWYVMMVMLYVECRLSEAITHFGEEIDVLRRSVRGYIGQLFFVGDDVVLPAEWADTLMDVMRRLYRIPNAEKTFVTGPYRESCGIEALGNRDISRVYYPRGLVFADDLSPAKWDAMKEAYVSPVLSLVSHHNELRARGYEASAEVIRMAIAGAVRLDIGLDPIGMFSDTIVGTSGTVVKSPTGEESTSVFFEVPRNGSVLLYSPKLKWVDAAPSKKCWCDGVPANLFHVLEKDWEREIFFTRGNYVDEFKGIDDAYPALTQKVDYASNVHKIPYVTLELVSHF